MPPAQPTRPPALRLDPANGQTVDLPFAPDALTRLAGLLGRAEARALAADLRVAAAND